MHILNCDLNGNSLTLYISIHTTRVVPKVLAEIKLYLTRKII